MERLHHHSLTACFLAAAIPAAAQDPIGTPVATYDLVNPTPGQPENRQPYGLAFDYTRSPRRLYVSDHTQPSADWIFVYEVGASGLTELETERIFTFDNPRGLAFTYIDQVPYLYALESNTTSTSGVLTNRLWRYDMLHRSWVSLDLNHANFGVTNRELLGLSYDDGDVFIGYDTNGMSNAVRFGVLRVKVLTEPHGTDWWARATVADPTAIVGHLPNGGRGPFTGTTYERDPCRGLATMVFGGTHYLCGTSLGSYAYVAEGSTGRGIFYFKSPTHPNGTRYQRLYDLDFGDSYLWALERTDDNHANVVHKIKMTTDLTVPEQSNRHVRRITMSLRQTTTGSGLGRTTKGMLHNYMIPNSNALRPSQDRDGASITYWCTHGYDLGSGISYPGGDTGSAQLHREVQLKTVLLAKEVASTQAIDVWTSAYRQFVYPHLCSTAGAAPGYLTTSIYDDMWINGILTDAATYRTFMTRVEDAMRAEYGATAVSSNPFWIARNVAEFLRENFDYGVPDDSEMEPGESSWNPVHYKLQRFLRGGGPDLLTCSSTAFVSEALCRSVWVPSRWVGTTMLRNTWMEDKEEVSRDKDEDGLMGLLEFAVDESYHRWSEVWLGPIYGWQRFDGTPADARYEQSQFDMMARCAAGVTSSDLVTTVGKGYYSAMFDAAELQQYYNTCGHYDGDKWKEPAKAVSWSVPCHVFVNTPSSPQSGATLNVTWTVSGRWDLDPAAKVSVFAVLDGSTARIKLGGSYAPSAGSATVSIGSLASGKYYRVLVVKDDDDITGGKSGLFLRKTP